MFEHTFAESGNFAGDLNNTPLLLHFTARFAYKQDVIHRSGPQCLDCIPRPHLKE
jgi:hypothetical protein